MWPCLWIILLMGESVSAAPDFDTQVMPILTKAGCNSGSCHGAAVGRGGFQLSLYGSRPAADFEEITRALEGRRIDRLQSDRSLLLLKPTEQLSHEGGTRLEINGRDYRTIQQWIEFGAKRGEDRKLREFKLTSEPIDAVANSSSGKRQFQLLTTAEFTDGTIDNVLPWTVLTPDDPGGLSISETGQVTLQRPGRHLIMARYLDQVRPLELILPWHNPVLPPQPDDASSSIDDFIDVRLAELGLTAAPASDDFTFIRRVTLDLTGRLPSPSAVLQFAGDTAADKRSVLIDRLLDSDEFVEFWGHQLALLFRVSQLTDNPVVAKEYYLWLRNCVERDLAFTDVARKMLLGEGSVRVHGQAGFYYIAYDARSQAEVFSKVFMGVRLQCANCHDHPLDAWTQDDYHGLAAIFARIKRGDEIRVGGSGDVIHPATGEPAMPKIPGGPILSPDEDHRAALAAWLTSADNPYFAKSIVNRVWSHLLGRGLVDPVDDLRATNPATHPELLNWLAQDFADHGYKLRHLIRRICNTQVYARGARVDSQELAPAEFYVAAISRPLSPEVFMDAVVDVSRTAPTGPSTLRMISFKGITASSAFATAFGGCTDFCESPAIRRSDLAVQLRLMNGAELNSLVTAKNILYRWKSGGNEPIDSFINECYLRVYSRVPRNEELTFWKNELPENSNTDAFFEVVQDMLWSLLNSDEFCTNH